MDWIIRPGGLRFSSSNSATAIQPAHLFVTRERGLLRRTAANGQAVHDPERMPNLEAHVGGGGCGLREKVCRFRAIVVRLGSLLDKLRVARSWRIQALRAYRLGRLRHTRARPGSKTGITGLSFFYGSGSARAPTKRNSWCKKQLRPL